MLKRKIYNQIEQWRKNKNNKCLVIQGARQVGKTYVIEKYANDNYDEYLMIDFKQTPSASEIFSGDLTVENMVMAMRFR